MLFSVFQSKSLGSSNMFTGDLLNPSDLQVLSVGETARVTGLSRSSLYRLADRGEFVPRVQLSQRRFGYRLADVREWLTARLGSKG